MTVLQQTIKAHTESISSLDVVECGSKVCLVSGSFDNTIKIWDLGNPSWLTLFLKTIHTFTMLQYS